MKKERIALLEFGKGQTRVVSTQKKTIPSTRLTVRELLTLEVSVVLFK